jgi:hypothetical protein
MCTALILMLFEKEKFVSIDLDSGPEFSDSSGSSDSYVDIEVGEVDKINRFNKSTTCSPQFTYFLTFVFGLVLGAGGVFFYYYVYK